MEVVMYLVCGEFVSRSDECPECSGTEFKHADNSLVVRAGD